MTCVICRHKQLEAINMALAAGEPLRSIAKRFKVTDGSVGRHKKHVAALIAKVEERRVTIADRLQTLVISAIQTLEDAFKQDDFRLKIMAATTVEKYARLYLDASKNSDNETPNAVRFIEERHPELRDEFFAYINAQ